MAQSKIDVLGYMWGVSPRLAHAYPHPTLGHIYRDANIFETP